MTLLNKIILGLGGLILLYVEKVVYRDRVVEKGTTTIKKPDGTVITKETEKTKESERTDDRSSHEVLVATAPVEGNDYSAGVSYRVTSQTDITSPESRNIGVTVGRRLIGDVWLQIEATQRDMTMGVAVHW